MKTSGECEDQLARLSWPEGVPAPVDADGKTVPLGVSKLYMDGGGLVTVGSICFNGSWWFARCTGGVGPCKLDKLHLALPDSWERLEEDARRIPCEYFGLLTCACGTCPGRDVGCADAVIEDVIRRAKALAGVTQND